MLSKITASLICMDLTDLKSSLDTLLDNGINQVHADFMDNNFVPRLGVSPELIRWIKKRYGDKIKVDSHLMVKDPISCIDVIAPCSDFLFFHYEAVSDPTRVLQYLRKNYPDLKIGVAYNLSSQVNSAFQKMGLIDGFLLMGISPGVLGTNSYPEIVREKIKAISSNSFPSLPIYIDGSVNFQTISDYTSVHNVKIVCGNSTLFKAPTPFDYLSDKLLIECNVNKIKGLLR